MISRFVSCNPNSTHSGRAHDHVEHRQIRKRFEVESPIADSQLSRAKLAALCRNQGCERSLMIHATTCERVCNQLQRELAEVLKGLGFDDERVELDRWKLQRREWRN